MPNSNYPGQHPESESLNLTCGTCQWFSSGFKGDNCQKTREVELGTTACIEYTERLSDIFHGIAQDKYILGIRDNIRSARFKIDEYIILEELRGYIVDDDLSKFDFGTTQDLEAVDKALKKIVSYRSRCSQIYTTLIDMQYELEELMDHTSLWLYSKYDIIRELRNESQRKSAIDRVIPELIGVRKTLNKLLGVAKHIDEKLNANERALISISSSAGKLWYSREGLGHVTGTKVYR